MPKINIMPDNVNFDVNENETILDAGLRLKYKLPHSCKNGACGACKTMVLDGKIKLDPYNDLTLSQHDKEQGYTLLCKAHPLTDVKLEIDNLFDAMPIRILPVKVSDIIKINQVAILKVKLPSNLPFNFYAGQYVEILLKGKNRLYSIGSSPTNGQEIELHIKYHQDGVFSQYVWNELKVGDILRFKGPLGHFRLQSTNNPIICVCTGTGFAPLKSILDYMAETANKRKIYFYWGNKIEDDFYALDIIKKWQQQLDIKIILALSQDKQQNYASGRVTNLLNNDFANFADYEIYACGNPTMIEEVFHLTCKRGLNKKNFFSDAFIPSVIE
ncbi:MAG: FAD-binding oxidoreductase [Burkholderiales bacterium]|nr:FAD-binding oxidoreductase [Burkholderiales bacterium]